MDKIGTRMKEFYELPIRTALTRRVPAIIRVDGKSFHSFAKKFEKPFDHVLQIAMQNTALELCRNIQGCKFAYTQSDEISLLLTDYENINTSAWFDYEVQKICSVAASMTTLYFNRAFCNAVNEEGEKLNAYTTAYTNFENRQKIWKVHQAALEKGAMFDARCFNIPAADVANYFYWRELDAIRNSIQMIGHTEFTQKELHKKTGNEIKEMLKKERGIDWDKLPIADQRGSCVRKLGAWNIDVEPPIFKDAWEYVTMFL